MEECRAQVGFLAKVAVGVAGTPAKTVLCVSTLYCAKLVVPSVTSLA